MVLYHVTTAYQLLNCMEHSVLLHSEQKTILLMADFLIRKYPQYKQVVYKNFFDEVYVFPYAEIKENEEDLKSRLNSIYKACIPYEIEDFEEIYCAGIQMWFSLYLIQKNQKFVAFEEASGGYTRPEILMHNDERISKFRYDIMIRNDIYNYENECIIYTICNMKAQKDLFKSFKIFDFDPVVQFQNMAPEFQNGILEFFNCPSKIEVNSDSVLLLTQQLANLGVVSFEEQIIIYQLFVDYFFPETKLVIKTHPDDQVYYKWLFPDAIVITDKFPSELLPFIFENKPNTIATIYSTGIFNISGMFNESFELDMGFENSYKDMDEYYVAGCLLKKIGAKHIKLINIDSIAFDAMFSKIFDENEKRDEKICKSAIVCKSTSPKGISLDELQKMLQENQIIVCLDQGMLSSENLEILKKEGRIIPIEINRKKVKKEYVFIEEKKKWIYLFVKSDVYMEEKIMFKMTKNLRNTGVEIEAFSVDEEDYEKVMLKAQLKATEERLLFYIEENEKLRLSIQEAD